MLRIISDKQASITSKLLTPRTAVDDKNIYSFEGFLQSLRVLAAGTVQGIYFYIGHTVSRERAYRKRGMVNVAAFLSYTRTVAVYNTICDERNVDGINNKVGAVLFYLLIFRLFDVFANLTDPPVLLKFPLSNACGQYGLNYQNLRCDPSESFMECP